MLTQFFDYLGSIINYAAVGGAILYLSRAEGQSESEIAALVARGSYSCLYLIDAFSQVFFFRVFVFLQRLACFCFYMFFLLVPRFCVSLPFSVLMFAISVFEYTTVPHTRCPFRLLFFFSSFPLPPPCC